MAHRKRLGELLVDTSLLTEDQFSLALQLQKNTRPCQKKRGGKGTTFRFTLPFTVDAYDEIEEG